MKLGMKVFQMLIHKSCSKFCNFYLELAIFIDGSAPLLIQSLLTPIAAQSARSTRQSSCNFVQPRAQRLHLRRSVIFTSVADWNSLPTNVKFMCFSQFKAALSSRDLSH